MKKYFISIVAFLLISNFQYAQKEITLTDIWASRTFYPNSVRDIVSMKDGEHYCVLKDGILLVEYDYKTGKEIKTITRTSELKTDAKPDGIEIDEFAFNSDETKLLIGSETESIYRHSTMSNYYVYDLVSKKITLLSSGKKQRLAAFSPDGTKVAFIVDNNIFVKDLMTNIETQITKDGLYNNIINGTTDWVYEEEFSFTGAFFWSPDGNKIAYYKMDESKVKEYDMTMYGELYPEQYKYKYPKAGEDNSIVTIWIYDVKSNSSIPADIGPEKNQYIPRIKWTKDPNQLSIQRMNRLQNKLEILLTNAANGSSKVIYNEENKCYIDITDNLTFLNDKKSFLISSEKDGYNHIYQFGFDGNMIRQITKGNWDVDAFKGIDEKNQIIYFTSSEISPMDRDLYSIKLDGTGKKRISSKKGVSDVEFSNNFKYYVSNFSDANTPYYSSINKSDGKELVKLEDNSNVLASMKEYGFGKKEFFNFKTTENIELNGWIIKPLNFDSTKKYPVLMYVYGGPGSQTVENQWSSFDFAWFQMLAQKGYLVVSVDNRGTGARGAEFKKMTYMQLGKFETIDQIETAKYLGKLKYIDSKRIGIFGWSYGGYMSSLCMTKGSEYFKTGIAVAPVTNWRNYDNIYTERYMRTPQENPKGYDENSPINFTKKLNGKFLLVHGVADDNVHIQNSMELIKSLVDANKQFEMQFYPNKNHGIYGGNTRFHLYTRMTEFLLKNL
ncbi:MAG: S9 family peptidase [Bacteroidetes bacterium]|nr:S9 family peptidase [Bacteroidota bacterium]